MTVIAVVGATGNIGSRVTARLIARGDEVRAVARTPGPGGDGITPVPADLTDPAQARSALEGAVGVYLTPPLGGEDPLTTETAVVRNVIDAAVAHGVEHVIMHSPVQGDRGNTGARILDNMAPLEHALAVSGVGFTILRSAWFLQNLWMARDYLLQGVVSMPWPGDMVWAGTDIDDVADAAAVFFERGPAKRGFDLHVPGGITGNGIAEAAGRVLGREVTYQEAPVSTREFTGTFPLSEIHQDLYAELFDYFRSRTYLGDPEALRQDLDGFEYRTVERFLREELFADR